MLQLEAHISLFLWASCVLVSIIIYGYVYGLRQVLLMSCVVLVSVVYFIKQPVLQEEQLMTTGQSYRLQGTVSEITSGTYNGWIVLDNVRVEDKEPILLKEKVQLIMTEAHIKELTINDGLTVSATKQAQTPQMNPSDMDYNAYLRSKKVSATLKVKDLLFVQQKDTWGEKVQSFLRQAIRARYSEEKAGIMEAVLLGEDERLEAQTKRLYNQSGIGHVLCISGFHMGIATSLILFLLSQCVSGYRLRYMGVIIGIWTYAYLTGGSLSTMRACILVTVGLIGRCLWQEADDLTTLSIASLILLLSAPYQLFSVGFQLSFISVLGMILTFREIEKKEWFNEGYYSKWQKSVMVWLAIQLVTGPVLAYHFYEVPLIVSLANFLVLPLYSIVIAGGWVSVLLPKVWIPIATCITKSVEYILSSIEWGIEEVMQWPLATGCVGRPSWMEILIFTGIVLLIGACIFEYITKYTLCKSFLILGCLYSTYQVFMDKPLSVTSLYVGQGDSTVITTPNGQVMVIDGGNFGKGKVVERYIKYKGFGKVSALMVSHSDADHIGGLTELLDSHLKIECVFISETDDTELLRTFQAVCKEKNIPVYKLNAKDTFYLDTVRIQCLAPIGEADYGDANNNSLVCTLEYGAFKALFTGDKHKTSDPGLYDNITGLSVLKVSHHGSRTGTNEAMLLKLNPRYAMISCGINNLYGHPHDEVLQLLEESEVMVSRTDRNGTICYETDGYYLKETKYRKEA